MARILEFLVEFCAGILVLGILEFPTMSSPSLTGGSRYRILDFGKFFLGILDLGILGYGILV